jgi:hypothetical protein
LNDFKRVRIEVSFNQKRAIGDKIGVSDSNEIVASGGERDEFILKVGKSLLILISCKIFKCVYSRFSLRYIDFSLLFLGIFLSIFLNRDIGIRISYI